MIKNVPVLIFDIISLLAVFSSIILVLSRRKTAFRSQTILIIILLLLFNFFYSLFLFIEWSGISGNFDVFEDYIGAFIPFWWAFVLYSLLNEVSHAILQEKEERLRSIFASMDDLVFVLDKDGIYRECYKSFDNVGFYRQPDGFLGKSYHEVLPSHVGKLFASAIENVIQTGHLQQIEYFLDFPEGKRWFSTNLSVRKNDTGNLTGITVIARDITIIKTAAEKAVKSLNEKELLLAEIHHRVKNNMAIIISLMHLQADSVNSEDKKKLLNDCSNRIRSMALVHEKLYDQGNFQELDFTEYVTDLVNYLVSSFPDLTKRITYKIEIANIMFSLDFLIPFGLIITEIVTNSLKHAFSNLPNGEIILRLSINDSGQKAIFTISDNGIGLSPDKINHHNSTIGLTIVNELVQQLHGRLNIKVDKGTSYFIYFQIKDASTLTK